ncbi:MAG: T9SS type A sorting domain-containing protein, partial [Candidatus Cloacimonetes bacterium]|nr:T9SS type A sorting domain-containing protein [Candidatus Cloacimonadota bacterium]
TNVTALIPTIEISDFATIDPESGTPQNFTESVEYTVTAQNGDEQIWMVTVTLLVYSEDYLTPDVMKLIGNFPNPFNPYTTILFELNTENTEDIELIIHNLKGQKIRQYSIFNNQSSIIWDGTDQNNQPVSSGIYFYRIQTSDFTETKKCILLK